MQEKLPQEIIWQSFVAGKYIFCLTAFDNYCFCTLNFFTLNMIKFGGLSQQYKETKRKKKPSLVRKMKIKMMRVPGLWVAKIEWLDNSLHQLANGENRRFCSIVKMQNDTTYGWDLAIWHIICSMTDFWELTLNVYF